MANIYGELVRGQFENLSAAPTPALKGRAWWRTDITTGALEIDTGSAVKRALLNDQLIVIGTSGTAATNARLYRSGTGKLQLVLGSDATAEGSVSSSFAQLSYALEQYTTGSRPAAAAGAGGQIILNTTDNCLEWQKADGSAWSRKFIGGTASANNVIVPSTGTITTLTALSRLQGAIYYATDVNAPYYDNGSALLPFGSGSGGTKNYLTTYKGNTGNGDFELNATTGWSTCQVTLSSGAPTGAPGADTPANITIAAQSGTILAGSYSLQVTVAAGPAVNGEGFMSSAFTIDNEDQAKAMTFGFFYKVGSLGGNYSGTSSNTWHVYIYDVTNTTWIQPAGVYGMTQSSGVGYCSGTFQTSATGTQYRIVVIGVNISALSGAIYFDDFSVGPQSRPFGAAITDPQNYTPTVTGMGTGTYTVNYATWQRVGNMVRLVGRIALSNGTGSSAINISMPSGLNIDFGSAVGTAQFAGGGYFVNGAASSSNSGISPVGLNTITNSFQFIKLSGTAAPYLTGGDIGTGTSGAIWYEVFFPIVGWSSNVQMSNDTDTRVVAFYVEGTPTGTINASDNAMTYPTVTKDTHGAYSSGIFTAPVSGYYCFSAGARYNATFAAGNTSSLRIKKNGTTIKSSNLNAYGAMGTAEVTINIDSVYLVAGDQIQCYSACSGTTPSYNSNPDFNWFSGMRISGPAVVAATETVSAKYYATGTTTSTPTAPINYDTKVYDTHGAVTTGASWKFTAPVSGRYRLSTFNNSASGTNSTFLSVYKNGTKYESICYSSNVSSNLLWGATEIQLNAGDYIDLRCITTTNISGNATQSADTASHIEISRLGN